jgi:23S rRNA (adenine2503-C2)-methyltransferase
VLGDRPSVFGSTLDRVGAICEDAGLPGYAKNQIADWLYKKHAVKIDDMTNLSARSRAVLARDYQILVSPPLREWRSVDGTKKYLFRTAGGALIESALIPDGDRATLCLSTQAGCKRACRFCMTGKQGLQEDITAGEILNQYRSLPERDAVSNIVYMGMGEPLDNIGPVLDSLEVFTSAYGYGLSPRRITVSTVGILPELTTLIDATECSIAVSLHSPFEQERKRIMPVESQFPLARILEVIRNNPFGRQRRVSFEYILFDGVNDSRRHADELVRILHGIRCRVNLIPFNPNPEIIYRPTPAEGVESFQAWLRAKGMVATVRRSRGRDIEAACGLLSTKEELRRDRDQD